jgi:hypothetical protein
LHIRPHAPLTQAATPFGSVGQVAQAAPHPVASLSAAHRLPHRWYPDPHVKSHVVPSHVVVLAPVGLGHAVHDVVPQVSTLVLVAQMPAQSWVPVRHTSEHAAAAAMHAPAHSFMPVGQAGTHAVPSQVTVPPAGDWHAVHDVVPQLPTSRLLTQRPPQMWYPALQAMPHAPPTH